jgi:hypothetical protein
MANLRLGVMFVLLAVAGSACGSDAAASAWHGTWVEPGGKPHGHVLEIDGGSAKFLLHGPGPGGHDSHDHWSGAYRRVADVLVLDGTWESNQKTESATLTRTATGVRLGLSTPIDLVAKP